MSDAIHNARSSTEQPRFGWTCCEVLLIFCVFFLIAGRPTPAVNEAHYLAKAKHYWNPEWCPGDLFLESKDAHLAFNWTFGWITMLVPLTVSAWIGRLLTWFLLAWAWQRLSVAILPQRCWSVLSAAALLCLIEHFHLAGEWLVGGAEAKGFAFVCLLLALGSLVRGRFRSMWILLGASTFFHVLVGGWSMVAAAFVWCTSKPRRPSFAGTFLLMLLATLIASPSLLAGLDLSRGVSPDTMRQANRIYVFERLGHHVAPANVLPATYVKLWDGSADEPGYYVLLPSGFVLRHGALLLVWLLFYISPIASSQTKQQSLQQFVAGTILIAAVGSLLSVVALLDPDLGARLLRYYWFRLTDIMVPMGVTFRVLGLVDHWQAFSPIRAAWSVVVVIVAVTLGLGATFNSTIGDVRPAADQQALPSLPAESQNQQIYRDWRRVCQWMADNTQPTCRVLTPFAQQTFKWYAGRSEVVTYKDVPQDADSLVQWRSRLRRIYPPTVRQFGLSAHPDKRLLEIARQHGAEFLIVDRTRYKRPLGFPRLYPSAVEDNSSYEVYWMPIATD